MKTYTSSERLKINNNIKALSPTFVGFICGMMGKLELIEKTILIKFS